MKRRVLLTAVLIIAGLFSSCRTAEAELPANASPDNVTLNTAALPSISLVEPELTDGNDAPVTEPGVTSTADETVETKSEEAVEQFSMPQEFYDGMAQIVEKYGLNLNCDNTENCACEPEYEVVGEDGKVIQPREKVMAVYYLDVLSGFEYELNPGAHFPIASTVKIPFCTLIYKKMTDKELDPEMIMTYEERHYFKGTGVINQGSFGDTYTLQEVLTYAITRSDNTAYEMLKDLATWDEFSRFLFDNGCTHSEDLRQSKQKICCESAGAYGKILSDFLRSDSEYVPVFKDDLANTRIKMLKSDWPIYRKYGWAGFSFHDIAYVDAPRPYVLAVLTNLEGEAAEDYDLFKDISSLVEKCSGNSAE